MNNDEQVLIDSLRVVKEFLEAEREREHRKEKFRVHKYWGCIFISIVFIICLFFSPSPFNMENVSKACICKGGEK